MPWLAVLHLALGAWMLSYFKTPNSDSLGQAASVAGLVSGLAAAGGASSSSNGTATPSAIDWGGGAASAGSWAPSSLFYNNDAASRFALRERLFQPNSIILLVPFIVLGALAVRGGWPAGWQRREVAGRRLCGAAPVHRARLQPMYNVCCGPWGLVEACSAAALLLLPACRPPAYILPTYLPPLQLLHVLAGSVMAAFGLACCQGQDYEGLPPFSRAKAEGMLQGGWAAASPRHACTDSSRRVAKGRRVLSSCFRASRARQQGGSTY